MPYPTRTQIHAILLPLSLPPSGIEEFFTHVGDDVKWTVTGHTILSNTWTDLTTYRSSTFAKIGPLLASPGMKLKVSGGEEGIIVSENGWAVVDLKTVDTYTKSGVLYDQHYAWHMRFDEEGRVREVKTWMDTAHFEAVLGGEMAKQDRECALKKDGEA